MGEVVVKSGDSAARTGDAQTGEATVKSGEPGHKLLILVKQNKSVKGLTLLLFPIHLKLQK